MEDDMRYNGLKLHKSLIQQNPKIELALKDSEIHQ